MMATAKAHKVEWSSDLLEVLQQEIAELNQHYLVELELLRQAAPGNDSYIEHWAKTDVLLYWLKMKIEAAHDEMERLAETWPD